MSADKTATARAALSALSKSQVRPFLNAAKLAQSELFAEIAAMAADHALQTGDFGYIERTLLLVRSSRCHDQVASWFATKLGVQFLVAERGVKVKKSGAPAKQIEPLNVHLKKAVGWTGQVVGVVHHKLGKSKSTAVGKEYVDMLDHPSRLPGSFGSGRRR